jgi:ribosomal protein S18 acetylase RimI-like enzyme
VWGEGAGAHTDGTIWSAALWATRTELQQSGHPVELFDRLVARALLRPGPDDSGLCRVEAVRRRRSFADFLKAIIDVAQTDDPECAQIILRTFADRGINPDGSNEELRDRCLRTRGDAGVNTPRPRSSGSRAGGPRTTWQVQPAQIEDAELVYQIMREAYLEYEGALDPPMSGSGENAAHVADAMQRGGAVLAWDGATPVGSARYRLSNDFVHIKRVSVLPHWRGRGIATAMLRYIEGLAISQGRTGARLQVRMSLAQNLELYQHVGYQIARVKAHPRGEDEVGTLVKQLDCGISVQAFRLLRGPNVHWREPVMEALIEVADHGTPGETMSGFLAALDARSPTSRSFLLTGIGSWRMPSVKPPLRSSDGWSTRSR